MKKLSAILISLILTISLVACGGGNSSAFVNPGDSLGGGGTGTATSEVDVSAEESVTESAGSSDLSELSGDTDSSSASEVEAISDGALEISEAGDYVLTGEYPYGVKITAKKNSEVHIFLNGASVTADGACALYSEKAIEATITVVGGTTNLISNKVSDTSDTSTYNALHIKGNLSINGGGELKVVSESKSGIKASKVLQVVGAAIDVTAASHGLTAQTVIAQDCAITVSAGKDGIQAESEDYITEEDEDGNVVSAEYVVSDGYVSLKSVAYTANTYGDGIQADTFVLIDGGTYNITTTGVWVAYSSANISTYELETDDFRWTKSGSTYGKVASDEVSRYGVSKLYALAQGCKGIKVGELEYEDADGNTVTITDGDYNILIKGGTFNINSSDDAIHANSGNVIIKDGTFTIATLDDGITADELTRIDGGSVTITTSYEGIEGAYVEINGGSVDLYATDDGINAASDDSKVTEHIIITGGSVVVKSDGDGLDSNGNIRIEGGTVIVHGPTSGGDAALDADSGILVNGGYLFATGSLGMVETPSTNSKQYVVSFASQSSVAANTAMTLKDSSGETLFAVTTQKTCQSIILSCPELQSGSSYTLYGGSSSLATFTVSSIITSIGSGGSGSGGPGGPGGPGRR